MGNKGFLCILIHRKTENCQGKEQHNSVYEIDEIHDKKMISGKLL